VRTVPDHVYAALRNGDFTLLASYLRAFRSAARLLYPAPQFLWSPARAAVLDEKLRTPARHAFRLVVVRPLPPDRVGAGARALHERQRLTPHYPGEQRGARRVECKQPRILLGEKRSVRARGGKQEQAHGCHRTAEDEKQLHLSLAPRGSRLSTGAGSCWGERTVNRFHGDSRCSSRLVSALS